MRFCLQTEREFPGLPKVSTQAVMAVIASLVCSSVRAGAVPTEVSAANHGHQADQNRNSAIEGTSGRRRVLSLDRHFVARARAYFQENHCDK
jgi:hypothetical protein